MWGTELPRAMQCTGLSERKPCQALPYPDVRRDRHACRQPTGALGLPLWWHSRALWAGGANVTFKTLSFLKAK